MKYQVGDKVKPKDEWLSAPYGEGKIIEVSKYGIKILFGENHIMTVSDPLIEIPIMCDANHCQDLRYPHSKYCRIHHLEAIGQDYDHY